MVLLMGSVPAADAAMRWRDLWRLVQTASGGCKLELMRIKIGERPVVIADETGTGTSVCHAAASAVNAALPDAWPWFRMHQRVPELGSPEWNALARMFRCLEADAVRAVEGLARQAADAEKRWAVLATQRWEQVDVTRLGSEADS